MPKKPEPKEMPPMTDAERRANWWHYHWHHVLIGGLAVLAVCFVFWERAARETPDSSVALVLRFTPTNDELTALRDALEAVCPDTNGDGEISVALNVIRIDYTSTDLDDAAVMDMTANVDKLNADFYTKQSGIFLLDDPANFQSAHGALACPDGTTPPDGTQDWESLAIAWSECAAVADVSFMGADTGGLWFARRIAETEADRTALSGAAALWDMLFPAEKGA